MLLEIISHFFPADVVFFFNCTMSNCTFFIPVASFCPSCVYINSKNETEYHAVSHIRQEL